METSALEASRFDAFLEAHRGEPMAGRVADVWQSLQELVGASLMPPICSIKSDGALLSWNVRGLCADLELIGERIEWSFVDVSEHLSEGGECYAIGDLPGSFAVILKRFS